MFPEKLFGNYKTCLKIGFPKVNTTWCQQCCQMPCSWMFPCVMVCARSRSFQRIIIGWLRRSLRWWPPHHCSVPPLPSATLVGNISTSVGFHPLLWYHQQTCIFIIAITNQHHALFYCSTTRAPPHSTHIPCLRPIISCTHQFSRSWVSVATRTCEDLSQHPSAPFGVQVFLLYVPFYNHMLS